MFTLKTLLAATAIAAALSTSVNASASTLSSSLVVDTTMLVKVSGGCGANGWRGPWGHCRYTPYYGPLPNGYFQPRPYNGCPPGYWRGPYGHCRNTPFHGRLPDGSWR
jgi:hypothetical protein